MRIESEVIQVESLIDIEKFEGKRENFILNTFVYCVGTWWSSWQHCDRGWTVWSQ